MNSTTTTTPAPTMPKLHAGTVFRGLWQSIGIVLHVALTAWPITAFLLVAALAKLCLDLRERRRLARSGIDQIDSMDGRTFELFLATLFERLGFRVELTSYRGDYGADLIVVHEGRRIAVQAKRWNGA